MTDAQKRLDEVRASITAVLKNGQRLRRGDREVQMAELNSLRQLEKQYAQEVEATQGLVRGRGRNRISYLAI